MDKKYLLAAEADKIQNAVFHSSRLREVAGASSLLARFCQEEAKKMAEDSYNGKVYVSDGGAFRIVFPVKEKAIEFGQELKRRYRAAMGAEITVADPVEFTNNEKEAMQQAQKNLREAKAHTAAFTATAQNPFTAFCGSCGTGLAAAYTKQIADDAGKMYLCKSCLNKKEERERNRYRLHEPLYERITGGKYKKEKWFENVTKTEDLKFLDRRSYVAYIVADGNAMGEIFSKCDKLDTLKSLSDNLQSIMYDSLEEATAKLMALTGAEPDGTWLIPVWPLILAGDDLFAVIPAPWSLDFAHQFAKNYEKKLTEFLAKNLNWSDTKATIGVAVVICKANYPYSLAHQVGEYLLGQAKKMSKRYKVEHGGDLSSVINFTVITGSQLAFSSEEELGEFRPTLRPYWLEDKEKTGWGIPIQRLIEQRYALRSIPKKRLAELRAHFDKLRHLSFTEEDKSMLAAWKHQLERILTRILEVSGDERQKLIKNCLEELGGQNGFYEVDRATDKEIWHGHALPDLLDVWDYALDMDKSKREYEED